MAEKLSPIPLQAAVLDRSGLMTQPWAAWFRQVFTRIGGFEALTNLELNVTGTGSVTEAMLGAGIVSATKLANQLRTVTGTRAAPVNITAAGGVAPSGKWDEVIFVQGSGGAIDITANPQIAVGTAAGQTLTLIGRGNALTLDDGTGLSMNGSMTLDAEDMICFVWDGTNWNELWRKDAT